MISLVIFITHVAGIKIESLAIPMSFVSQINRYMYRLKRYWQWLDDSVGTSEQNMSEEEFFLMFNFWWCFSYGS